ALWRKLVELKPGNMNFSRGLAVSYHDLANVHLERGDPTEAITALKNALAIFEKLTCENPSVTLFQHHASRCYLQLGGAKLDLQQLWQALAAFKAGRALLEDVRSRTADDMSLMHDLARMNMFIGRIHTKYPGGDRREGATALKAAQEIWDGLTRRDPERG